MKKLALIAHDNKKADIVAWAMKNVESLKNIPFVEREEPPNSSNKPRA